jgi:predicted nucleic acid-binding protein
MTNDLTQFFVDSNFLVALIDEQDSQNKKAQNLVARVYREDSMVLLSDIVLSEVLSVLAKRCEAKKKSNQFPAYLARIREFIADAPILSVYELLPKNYNRIFDMMKQSLGKLSFNDCLIVVFLNAVPEVTLVSFDADFIEIDGLKVLAA